MGDDEKKLLHAIQDLHFAVRDLSQGFSPARPRDESDLRYQSNESFGSGFNLLHKAFEVMIKNQEKQIELLETIARNSRR